MTSATNCAPDGRHQQAVEAEGHAGTLGKAGVHRVEQPALRRKRTISVAAAECRLGSNAAAQLTRIGQLLVAVADFDAREIKLKALGNGPVLGANSRKRGLAGRIVVQKNGRPLRERWFDSRRSSKLSQPSTSSGTSPDGALTPIRFASSANSPARRPITDWPNASSNARSYASRGYGCAGRVGSWPRQFVRPFLANGPNAIEETRDKLFDKIHLLVISRLRAVPLDDRELGVVQLADLAAAKGVRDLKDCGRSRSEQPFHREFGRRLQKQLVPSVGLATVSTRIGPGHKRLEVRVDDHVAGEDRRFDLPKATRAKKCPREFEQLRPQPQHAKRCRRAKGAVAPASGAVVGIHGRKRRRAASGGFAMQGGGGRSARRFLHFDHVGFHLRLALDAMSIDDPQKFGKCIPRPRR